MAIVDFHMHLFSRPYFEALAALSPRPGTVDERLRRLSEETGIELPSPDLARHVERWLSEIARHGVDHLCAFASAPEELPALGRARALAGGRLTPFALVDPRAPGVAEKVTTLVREQGFGGVLLFPALHHFHIGDPECAELLAALDGLGAIAYVHCGQWVVKLRDLLGLPRAFDPAFANPLGLIPAASSHPRVRFVIPHFGAGSFRETLAVGAQCANLHVDTSSSNGWMATQEPPLTLTQVFERALEVFGASRILFGTDSNVFPAGWRSERFAGQRAALEALGVPAADQERIFSGNARRLLGLG
jgi:uncharacterized protein